MMIIIFFFFIISWDKTIIYFEARVNTFSRLFSQRYQRNNTGLSSRQKKPQLTCVLRLFYCLIRRHTFFSGSPLFILYALCFVPIISISFSSFRSKQYLTVYSAIRIRSSFTATVYEPITCTIITPIVAAESRSGGATATSGGPPRLI